MAVSTTVKSVHLLEEPMLLSIAKANTIAISMLYTALRHHREALQDAWWNKEPRRLTGMYPANIVFTSSTSQKDHKSIELNGKLEDGKAYKCWCTVHKLDGQWVPYKVDLQVIGDHPGIISSLYGSVTRETDPDGKLGKMIVVFNDPVDNEKEVQ